MPPRPPPTAGGRLLLCTGEGCDCGPAFECLGSARPCNRQAMKKALKTAAVTEKPKSRTDKAEARFCTLSFISVGALALSLLVALTTPDTISAGADGIGGCFAAGFAGAAGAGGAAGDAEGVKAGSFAAMTAVAGAIGAAATAAGAAATAGTAAPVFGTGINVGSDCTMSAIGGPIICSGVSFSRRMTCASCLAAMAPLGKTPMDIVSGSFTFGDIASTDTSMTATARQQ